MRLYEWLGSSESHPYFNLRSPFIHEGWAYYTDKDSMVRVPRPGAEDTPWPFPNVSQFGWEHASHTEWQRLPDPGEESDICERCRSGKLYGLCTTCQGMPYDEDECDVCWGTCEIAIGLCPYCEGTRVTTRFKRIFIDGVMVDGRFIERAHRTLENVEWSTQSVLDGTGVIFRAEGGVQGVVLGMESSMANRESKTGATRR